MNDRLSAQYWLHEKELTAYSSDAVRDRRRRAMELFEAKGFPTQKKPKVRPLFGSEFQDGFSVPQHVAAGDLILLTAGNHAAEGGFSGSIRTHDGVYFSGFHGQIDPTKNFFIANGGVQVSNF